MTIASDAILSQVIDTPVDTFRLNFEHLFQTSTGVLDIYLGSSLLASIAASPGSEPIAMSIVVNDPALLGLTGQTLSFNFSGLTGSQVLLDNIVITTIPPTLDGDLNLDDQVNAGDVLIAHRIASGLMTASTEQMEHGDVAPLNAGFPDPDGVINAADIHVIQQKALGLINF